MAKAEAKIKDGAAQFLEPGVEAARDDGFELASTMALAVTQRRLLSLV